METISIIVPIYKGNQYIDNLIRLTEENSRMLNREQTASVELLLVNDFPEEGLKIDRSISGEIEVREITNKKNVGIHGSRIHGLLHSNGEYIVFLDQDDVISPIYLREQFRMLGDYDAVVCNGIDQSLPIYDSLEKQQKTAVLKSYREGVNLIVSPGQVLLRKAAIPKAWMKNILRSNGADDYYLWFLMLFHRRRFGINPQKLFIHTTTDHNTSNNWEQMLDSINEMLSFLKSDGILSEEEIKNLQDKRKPREIPTAVKSLYERNSSYMHLLDLWLTLTEDGRSPAEYLQRNHMETIAIYGMGMLGRHLEKELRNTEIQIKYWIDQRWEQIKDARCIPLGAPMEYIDAIIITPIYEYQEIKEKLAQYYDCNMVSLNTLIKNIDVSIL